MTPQNGKESPPESRRKEIFLALVEAQDRKLNVVQSRKLMVENFGVTEREIRRIEEEGMEKQWPPLV